MPTNISLLSGFLKGSAQSKLLGQEREKEKELNALKKQVMQLQMQEMKLKAEREKVKNTGNLAWIEKQKAWDAQQNVPETQPSDTGTPMGQSMTGQTPQQKPTSLIESLSAAELMRWEDITGMKFLGAGGLSRQRGAEQRLGRQGDERNLMRMLSYMLSREKGSYFDKPVPADMGGGTQRVFESAYGPGGPGGKPSLGATPGVQPGVQGKPPASTLPVPSANLSQWRNPRMEMPSKVGQSPEQLMAQGYKPVNIGSISKAESIIMGMQVITELKGMMEKVFPDKEGGFADKFIEGPKRMVGAFLQTDTDARALQSYVNMTLAPLIRTLGEKGALSDTDVKRAIKGMPSLFSGGKVAWMQVKLINNLLERASQSVMGLQFGSESPKSQTPKKYKFNPATGRLE